MNKTTQLVNAILEGKNIRNTISMNESAVQLPEFLTTLDKFQKVARTFIKYANTYKDYRGLSYNFSESNLKIAYDKLVKFFNEGDLDKYENWVRIADSEADCEEEGYDGYLYKASIVFLADNPVEATIYVAERTYSVGLEVANMTEASVHKWLEACEDSSMYHIYSPEFDDEDDSLGGYFDSVKDNYKLSKQWQDFIQYLIDEEYYEDAVSLESTLKSISRNGQLHDDDGEGGTSVVFIKNGKFVIESGVSDSWGDMKEFEETFSSADEAAEYYIGIASMLEDALDEMEAEREEQFAED